MRSRGFSGLVVVLVLALAGALASRVGREAWSVIQQDMPVLTAADIEAAAGEGIMVGLLGGFRAITADLLWVRTNAVWETRDLPGTQASIRLVTVVDARPLIFWINGARMIAYDMPVWRIDAAGGDAAVPHAVQRRLHAEQARAALDLLERARAHHPDAPLVLIEMANIHHRKLGDLPTAAALYRQAAAMPGAPYYAARIHGEMLKQLGRPADALAWLIATHRSLPRDDPMANTGLVLARIRELEDQLQLPVNERYGPDPAHRDVRESH